MKTLIFLLAGVFAVAAAPDSLRYERMTTPELVAEVLGSKILATDSRLLPYSEMVAQRFRTGEKSNVAWTRALEIKKKYPYCVLTTHRPDAPVWSMCIFRFERTDSVIVGKEEVWIHFHTEGESVTKIMCTLTIWDL